MNEPKQPVDRWAVMLKNVRDNSRAQVSQECRENYLRSCEAHGGDLAKAVAIVRQEYDQATS